MNYRFIILFFITGAIVVQPAQAQSQWQAAAPMPTARANTASVVLDGQVYVIGGQDNLGNILDIVERYDPVLDTWQGFPSLGQDRAGAAAVVYNGKIHVMGGHRFSSDDGSRNVLSDVEVFNPGQNRWESFPGLEEDRDGLAAIVLNGKLYAIGGANENGIPLATVEWFNEAENEWILEDENTGWMLDRARVSFTTVPVSNAAYTFGGFGSFSGPVSQTERYEQSVGTTLIAPFEDPRGGLSASAVGNVVFVIGGRKQDDKVTARVDVYITTSAIWEGSAAMNVEREDLSSASVSNIVYAFGGRDDRGNVLASVERFGPVDVAVKRPDLPADFYLGHAHPNPFGTATRIPIEISGRAPQDVSLVVFDVLGREVKRLLAGVQAVGKLDVVWDGTGSNGRPVASGTYFYRLTQGQHVLTRRLIHTR